jgi:LacI family transcriptional regulator
MHEVAALAGVSQATVSLVLNGTGRSRYTEATRARVFAAVEELDYRANIYAKVLREGVSGVIGFIGDSVASSPFAGQLISAAQDAAWDHDLMLMSVNTDGRGSLEAAAVDALRSYSAVGIVYAFMYHRAITVPDSLSTVRTVVLNSRDLNSTTHSVYPDEHQGGYAATRRLISAGHSRIAMINIQTLSSGLPAAVGRHRGYCDALTDAGIGLDPALHVEGLGGPAGGYQAIPQLLELNEPPTAIFCGNDRTAWGAYQALQAHGVRVPDDMSIIGFDNQEIISTGLHPELTSVELPFVAMAKRAIDIIADPSSFSFEQPIECPIIERSSIVNRVRP